MPPPLPPLPSGEGRVRGNHKTLSRLKESDVHFSIVHPHFHLGIRPLLENLRPPPPLPLHPLRRLLPRPRQRGLRRPVDEARSRIPRPDRRKIRPRPRIVLHR